MDKMAREVLFPGDSQLAHLMRNLDWSATELGSPDQWPEHWRAAVRLCLTSRIPIVMYLGTNFTVLYNDPYISFLGETKHPRYLGKPAEECWREVWQTIGPMLKGVYATGEATWSEDVLMFFARHLPLEQVYVRFTFGPLMAADGTIDGIFGPCTETTEKVVSSRRLDTLRKLAANPAEARTVIAACHNAAEVLDDNPYDVPYAAIYLCQESRSRAVLAASTKTIQHTGLLSESVSATDGTTYPWPLTDVLQRRVPVEVSVTNKLAGTLRGPWGDPTRQALVLPIGGPFGSLTGLLLIGVSGRQPLDNAYRTFFDLAAGHIGTAIADAQAYEEQHQRADALAELDRVKTAFFSNVSHEFRTPLTLMLSPLEEILARNTSLPPEERERLELVHRNSLRLLKLVNTLLDFSRIEAGRVQASFEPVDITALTAELSSVFRSAIEKAGMRLVIDCPSMPDPLYVDRDMWEKIVLNLLSNAFKFTFEGEIDVSLRDSDGHLELRVRDTGAGIPAHELPHIFDRFHRVKGMLARTYEGTGIGLALVKELVHLHGGMIRVESQPGKGSTFIVSVPKGTAHLPKDRIRSEPVQASVSDVVRAHREEILRWLPPEGQAEASTVSGDAPTTTGAKSAEHQAPTARILLADDNADMRGYIQRMLEEQYDVQAVSDGEAALEAARVQAPDLVLADIMMPQLDGFGLLRELRRDPALKTIPVILLSARAGEEAQVEGLEAGADNYLTKPFSSRELLARVRTTLEMARLRAEFHAEVELERSRLKYIFDKAPATVVILRGPEHVFESFNPAFTRLVGDRDLIGRPARQAFPEMEGQGFFEMLDQVYRTGQPSVGHDVPALLRHPDDGSFFRVFGDFVFQPMFDRNGSVTGIFIHGVDVTARKEAEEGLWESRQRLLASYERAPVGMVEVSPEGTYLNVNEEFSAMLGFSADEMIQRTVMDVTHPDDYARDAELHCQLLAGEISFYQIENRFIRKDGSICVGEVRRSLVRDSNGRALYSVGIITDITSRKQMEEERERLLTQEQAARQQAETANRLKDEFLATVSHELRTPLTSILGWAQMLRTGRLDSERTSTALQAMERNALTQKQLIDDLLDVSRIVSGGLRLDVHRVDPADPLEAAIESLLPSADAKRLRLQKVIDSDVGPIWGDPNRLQQIIWNLLSNAIKFTAPEGRIQVRLERTDSHIHIVVSDTGIGIKQDFLPFVFDQFRQADAKVTRVYGGLGLGLTIVRHLVELHGGSVYAESEGEGKGSTFTVRLPLMPVYQRETTSDREPPHLTRYLSQIECSDRLDGLKILAIDDECDTCELLNTMISKCGGQVTTATSADEALKILKDSLFDLIVADIGMPKIDGYEFIQQVRRLPVKQGGATPAIALTAYARTEDRLRALRAGYQMHVPKPIEYAELIAVMASVAKRHDAA